MIAPRLDPPAAAALAGTADGGTGGNLPGREEVGMRASPEVVLFVGGAVLTAAVLAVFVPFMVRAWREDSARRAAKDRAGGRVP